MSKEAKPIAVLYIWDTLESSGQITAAEVNQIMSENWKDYHVLVCPVDRDLQERCIELEVFYDKNFTVANYEELKNWITQRIQPSPPTDNKP